MVLGERSPGRVGRRRLSLVQEPPLRRGFLAFSARVHPRIGSHVCFAPTHLWPPSVTRRCGCWAFGRCGSRRRRCGSHRRRCGCWAFGRCGSRRWRCGSRRWGPQAAVRGAGFPESRLGPARRCPRAAQVTARGESPWSSGAARGGTQRPPLDPGDRCRSPLHGDLDR